MEPGFYWVRESENEAWTVMECSHTYAPGGREFDWYAIGSDEQMGTPAIIGPRIKPPKA